MKIGINEFVRRQTKESTFSYYDGSWDGLAALVEENFDNHQPGYKDGVILVDVPPQGFYTSITAVTKETHLEARFEPRREGEDPFLSVYAVGGAKLPAQHVQIVLYSHETLAVDGDATGNAEWEIVSINALATEDPEPMHPMVLARNQLHLPGGTKAEYTAEQFAESIIYWSKRVNVSR